MTIKLPLQRYELLGDDICARSTKDGTGFRLDMTQRVVLSDSAQRLEAAYAELEAERDVLKEQLALQNSLIDWLQDEAKASRTGLTISYRARSEDDCPRGYRLMRFHKIFDTYQTLRDAINNAMREGL